MSEDIIILDNEQKKGTNVPEELPILPLRNTVVYPYSVVPLAVGMSRSVRLVEDALKGDRLIGLATMKDPDVEEPKPEQIHETGTIGKIVHTMRSKDESMQVVIHGISRFKIQHWLDSSPYLRAQIVSAPENIDSGVETDALERNLRDLAEEIIALSPGIPREATNLLAQLNNPEKLVYAVSANTGLPAGKGQQILESDSLNEKLRMLIAHLTHEKQVLLLGKKIRSKAQENMSRSQREYYLHEQLKAIQKELGQTGGSDTVAEEYRTKIDKADLPEEAKKEAERELERIENMPPQSAEYSVIKNYLDWLVELPWNGLSQDQLDIHHARTVLDEDHYDLQDVKDRIIEYLAVRKLISERSSPDKENKQYTPGEAMGAILCLAGPPGVGKTSLGRSIARSLGRKFTRMSLGGIRDESEIRGHRRTYIGAMPGRIIQAIKRAGTRNPVFMLDEVDKVGADWRGDPSSALLEVLDPAQNHAFRDHYLDVDFDLSDVMFITTANQLETIPPPLRDRMEIIQLDGYTEHEKLHIARRYLVPRQIKSHGLREDEVVFPDDTLRKVIQSYTREAGVRNLEREIGALCRKAVVKIAAQDATSVNITSDRVRQWLKKEKFESELSETIEIPGIATGLAVTYVGGDILFVEATASNGKGNLTLTGQLGEVMRESAQIAHSYVRSMAPYVNTDPELFEKRDVHIHVPAGAIPKDGPSAGLAMIMSLASLFSSRPVRSDVGMTGEVTLRGRVLPVGGIKMKVLAAHRAGLSTVILPKRNEPDLEELPDEIRHGLRFVLVEHIEEALKVALEAEKKGPHDDTLAKTVGPWPQEIPPRPSQIGLN
jgi:ATP-dependent Lon protease